MARGKIFTNRKKTVRLSDDKKKHSSKSKKDKKSAQQKQEKKPVATDVFDYRTGVVYSIRPEDTDVHILEATVTSYLKEKGAIDDPKEYLTTAVHLGDPNLKTPPPSEEETVVPPLSHSSKPKSNNRPRKMEKPEIPVTFWREVKDPKTSNSYYWNPESNQTSWTLPENAVIVSEASERSEKITDPENEDDNGSASVDLVKAYNHVAKTVYGVETTGEVKGSTSSNSNGIATEACDTSPPAQNKKSKKEKKQKASDEIPVAAGMISPDLSNSSKNVKSRSNKNAVGSPASANVSVVGKAESPMLKLQVSTLSDEIFRKLEYLHVSRERISELQKLQIQLETRMEDWKEEQLSSKFFLTKLKSASDQVNVFVQDEMPNNWTCSWDRASCRYYFTNSVSGDISWEFPIANPDSVASSHGVSESAEEEKEEREESDDNSDPAQNQRTKVISPVPPEIMPPGPPPPLDPPMVQATVPPEANNNVQEPAGTDDATDTGGVIDMEEDEIPEVEMEEAIEDIDKKLEEEQGTTAQTVLTAESEMSKADTPPMMQHPPMQLYEDVGPIINQQTEDVPTVTEESQPSEEQERKDQEPSQTTGSETKESSNDTSTAAPVMNADAEEGEVGNSEEEKDSSSYSRKKKRSRYHSDSDDSYGGRRTKSSSSKKSRRRRDSYSDFSSDEYQSKSSYRRSRSRERGGGYYNRSDSEERYQRKSRGKYSRDDSDNEQYSSKRSSRKKSRSRSRDHGSRDVPYSRKDSKKKKKEKKRHRHRDSSSGDEYSSSRKSKSSRNKDRDYDFSGSSRNNRDSQSKDLPPPVEKKAFVPAKFKPKGKTREDSDEGGLSAAQLEMMQNIASATGGYMMNNPPTTAVVAAGYPAPQMVATDPQYAAYYASGGTTAMGTTYDPSPMPQPTAVTMDTVQPQPVLPEPLPPTTTTPMDDVTASVAPVVPTDFNGTQTTPENVPEAPPPIVSSEETQVTGSGNGASVTTTDKAEDIAECEMELDDNNVEMGGKDEVESQEKPSDEQPSTSVIPGSEATAVSSTANDNTNTSTASSETPPTTVDAITTPSTTVTSTDTASVATPTYDVATTTSQQQQQLPNVAPVTFQGTVPADTTTVTMAATGSDAQTVSASSATYSNPPTSYPPATAVAGTTTYDPTQQAAYAAYAQQYYSNPYQYYTDPAQYAAAMNYYAAYQAAYTGTYNAYYQQQGSAQNPPGAGTGGTTQK